MKNDAERAFQVKDSNWQESVYTFEDGHTDSSAEAFAYGFEDFLKHKAGEFAAEDKKAIFEKFADYMIRTYNGLKENIEVSDEIANVYDAFVQLDDNILAEAEKAVRMENELKEVYGNALNINVKGKHSTDFQFQLVGERSILRMAESEEKERILSDLAAAKNLDEKYKNLSPDVKATRIRYATGWENLLTADGSTRPMTAFPG